MDSQEPLKEENYVEIPEGKAKILFPKANSVFYNPVQIFNRDLSIAVINHYANNYWDAMKRHRQKGPFWKLKSSDSSHEEVGDESINESKSTNIDTSKLKPPDIEKMAVISEHETQEQTGLNILEALAASGLRSIRYALEIPSADRVVANDLSEEAYQLMCCNIEANKVTEKVHPCCRDASMLMYEHRDPFKRFDVIDIDPYGSPTTFLDSVVQACHDGGLLCITCTDTSILCGNHSETCYAKYGSVSLKGKYCHEMALRIILACLNSYANCYKRYIYPLLSCSVDFYCRVFVTVYTSPAEVKKSSSKLSMVYHCFGCGSYYLQPLGKQVTGKKGGMKYTCASGPPIDRKCEHCERSDFKLGGPIWSDPIHDIDFIQTLLSNVKNNKKDYQTSDRIIGLLTVAAEELPDIPLYHVLDELCSTLHCTSMSMLALRSAILDKGYRVSISHAHANAVKTDAPHHVIWDIMRAWVKENPVKNSSPNSPAGILLSKESSIPVSFVIRKDANPPSRLLKLARFPENPEANWGPKARAKRHIENDTLPTTKRKKNDPQHEQEEETELKRTDS